MISKCIHAANGIILFFFYGWVIVHNPLQHHVYFSTVSLKYNWHTISCIYLKSMMWYILAYTCETITTIKIRNLPIIPRIFFCSFKVPPIPPNPYSQEFLPLEIVFLWIKKHFLLRESPQRDKIVIYLNLSKWTAGGWGGWTRR